MLKKSIVTCWCFMFFVLSLSQQGNCAEQNHILFCRTFNDKWEPIDPSETFETNVVSWIAQGEKSFETPRIIVSLYKKIGAEERLLERKPMDVRPAWDTTGVRNMALPEEGTYILALDKPDGTPISSGMFTIKAMSISGSPLPEETLGTTLAKIFNKYLPKK